MKLAPFSCLDPAGFSCTSVESGCWGWQSAYLFCCDAVSVLFLLYACCSTVELTVACVFRARFSQVLKSSKIHLEL